MKDEMDLQTPAGAALRRLVDAYRSGHAEYSQRKRAFNFMAGGALVCVPIAIVLLVLQIAFSFPYNHMPLSEVVAFIGFFIICMLTGAVGTRLRVGRSRRTLQHAKSELDAVGYHVAIDRSRLLEPRLVFASEPPTGEAVLLLKPFEMIDFEVYDRAFWLH